MLNKRLIKLVPHSVYYIAVKVTAMVISLIASIVMWVAMSHLVADFIGVQFLYLDHSYSWLTLTKDSFVYYLTVILIAVLVRVAMIILASTMAHKSTVNVKLVLRRALYDKLARLGMKHRDRFSTAEMVQLSGEGVEQLEVYFANYLPQFFYALIAPLILFAVFSMWSFKTALVLLICVPLIPVSIVAVQKFAKKMLSKYWNAYASLADVFLDNLQGLTTLKVYSADEAATEKMNEDAEKFRKITMKVLTMQLNSVTIMDFVSYGGTALGTIIVAFEYMNGKLYFQEAFVMVLLASEFFLSMRALGSFFHVAMNGMAASDKMFELLDMPELEEGASLVHGTRISFDKVVFRYKDENQSKPALDHVSFDVEEGSVVAIAGKSGSGKSTIAKLLTSEITDYEGSVTVGGSQLKNISANERRQMITMVTANSYIFQGTVRSLLWEAKKDASDAEMQEVLGQVNIWDFVNEHGGLDMEIKERGSNLSGGQCQRLAIARAFLKDSAVYVFDEATSNIDVESENDIIKAIYTLSGKHTVIIISHRLANVVNAKRVVVMKEGHVVENGSHLDLIRQNAFYATLYDTQMRLEHFSEGVAHGL